MELSRNKPSDVDLDKNHILSLSELDYFSNIGFKYKCLLDKSDNNSSLCKALWDDKIAKPLVSKSWHNKQIVVGLKENDGKYFLIDKKQMKLYDRLTQKNCSNLLKKYKIN